MTTLPVSKTVRSRALPLVTSQKKTDVGRDYFQPHSGFLASVTQWQHHLVSWHDRLDRTHELAGSNCRDPSGETCSHLFLVRLRRPPDTRSRDAVACFPWQR